jgi:hypothetical protein
MRLLRSAPLVFCTAIFAAAATAQDPPPEDPDLPARLDELDDMVKDRDMTHDFQAIGLIQKLKTDVEKRHPKDQTRMAKAFGDVFKTGKVREGAKDVLYREAADALALLGEDGGKELSRYVEHKRFKDNIPLQAHLALALGKTEDDKQIDWLLETVTRSPHDELRAAAGEALGYFTKADLKDKREVVKDMIRAWGSLHSLATAPDPTDPSAPVNFGPQNARQTLRAVEGKWIGTLQKLTGVSHSQFQDWQHWLNKNPRWEPPGTK